MKFQDLDQAIKYIIDRMSESERDMIKKADPVGIHMALARWVNNEYISKEEFNFKELVFNKLFKNDPYLNKSSAIHNDNIVGIIIDEIIEKIKT